MTPDPTDNSRSVHAPHGPDGPLPPRASEVTRHPRTLDERVLGAGTTLRFVLLLLLFAAGSYSMYSGLANDLSSTSGRWVWCELAAGLNPGPGWQNGMAWLIANNSQDDAAYSSCVAQNTLSPIWPLVATAVLIAAAFVLYWLLPSWRVRRSRLMPLDDLDLPDIRSRLRPQLDRLVEQAGLASRPPKFYVDTANAAPSAVVFGRGRRYSICLHDGLLVLSNENPEQFRAVVLHELAHIANGDVDVTYATVALWRVFLIGAILPSAIDTVHALATHDNLARTWGFTTYDTYGLTTLCLIIVLSYLTRADILRTREIHADLTAVRWGAAIEAWDLGAKPVGSRSRAVPVRLRGGFSILADLWRSHPSWPVRRRSLRDPRPVFAPTGLSMFLTGAASDIAVSQLSSLPVLPSAWSAQIQALVGAGLAMGIASVALWRAVVYALLVDRPTPSGLRCGFWLGLGFAVSESTNVEIVTGRWFADQPEVFLVLVVMATLVLAWIEQNARLWVRAWRGLSLRPAMAVGILASWLAFAYMLYQWYSSWIYLLNDSFYSIGGVLQALGVSGGPLQHPPTILTLYAALFPYTDTTFSGLWWTQPLLWLVPLLVWCTRPARGRPGWQKQAVPGERDKPPLPRDWPQLRRVCCLGLCGGLLACAAVAATAAGLDRVVRAGTYTWSTYDVVYVAWMQVAICGAMLVTAAATALVVRRYWLIAALIAAVITAAMGLAAQYALLGIDGCIRPLDTMTSVCAVRMTGPWGFVWPTAQVVLQLGILASGVTALCVAGVLALRHRAGERATSVAIRAPYRRRVAPIAAVATVFILTIGLFAGVTAQSGLGLGGAATASADTSGVFSPDATGMNSNALSELQIGGWEAMGGDDLATDLPDALNEIISAFIPATPSVQQVTMGCHSLSAVMPDAEAYFTVPNAQGQQLWAQMLSDAQKVNHDCTAYLATPVEIHLDALANDVLSADDSGTAFLDWLNKQPLVPIGEIRAR